MMSDICLFLGNEDVHTANTYTQRQYYEVQVVFWVMLRSTPLQYTKYTPGKGGYVFLGKIRSSPSGTSPENRALSGLSEACCCEDQVTDSGGSTQTGARAARKNSRATTAVLALLPVLLPVRVRGSFRTDTY